MAQKLYANEIKHINQKPYIKQSRNDKHLIIKQLNSLSYIVKPAVAYKIKKLIIFGITSRCDSFKTRMLIRNSITKNKRSYEYLFFFLSANHMMNILIS